MSAGAANRQVAANRFLDNEAEEQEVEDDDEEDESSAIASSDEEDNDDDDDDDVDGEADAPIAIADIGTGGGKKKKQADGGAAAKLVPWRSQEKGPILKSALMKLAVIEAPYKKRKGGPSVDAQWKVFVHTLYALPEFQGLPVLSARQIKKKFNDVISEVSKEIGWGTKNAGRTTNLSNKPGSLPDTVKNVKVILQEREDKKAKAALKKQNAKQLDEKLDGIESALVLGTLTKRAKKKRAHSGDQQSASESVSSSAFKGTPASISAHIDQQLLKFLSGDGENAESSAVDRKRAKYETLERNMKGYFEGWSITRIIAEANIRQTEETIEQLSDVGIDVIVNAFTGDGKGSNLDYFTEKMQKFEVKPLVSHKLYLFLKGKAEQPDIAPGEAAANDVFVTPPGAAVAGAGLNPFQH